MTPRRSPALERAGARTDSTPAVSGDTAYGHDTTYGHHTTYGDDTTYVAGAVDVDENAVDTTSTTDDAPARIAGAAVGRGPFDEAVLAGWRKVGDPGAGSRWSSWSSLDRSCRGPRPWPAWLVTDASAIETDLGVLKTGKEADVVLVERVSGLDPQHRVVLAAKRYRSETRRDFHRAAAYTDGRSVRNTRDNRAMAKKTAHGRAMAAGQWAMAEWSFLTAFHAAGLPVPYPVQVDGTEILMELVRDDAGDPAARLAASRLEPAQLERAWAQLREAVLTLASLGYAHGDLSAYNLLVAGERLVIIDLPQAVDIVGNPSGMEFLHRDCLNVATWFTAKGLEVDGESLFGDAVAAAF